PGERAARPRARPRVVDPQDPRLGDQPAGLRARHGRHGPRRPQLVQRGGRRPAARAVGRAELQLHNRDDDLRRLERDPEEHHREDDPRFAELVTMGPRAAPNPGARYGNAPLRRRQEMNFDLSPDQKMLADSAAQFAKKESPVTRFRAMRED